jgi:hypothetical protein
MHRSRRSTNRVCATRCVRDSRHAPFDAGWRRALLCSVGAWDCAGLDSFGAHPEQARNGTPCACVRAHVVCARACGVCVRARVPACMRGADGLNAVVRVGACARAGAPACVTVAGVGERREGGREAPGAVGHLVSDPMETDGWRTPAPAGFPLTAGMSDGCRACDPAAAAPNADPILATEEAAPKSDTLDLARFSGFGTLNLTCTASQRASGPEAAEGHARRRAHARARARLVL